MKMPFRCGVLVLVLLGFGGCAGVPLSTLWHFRSFGAQEFVALDPAEIRVAVNIDKNFILDPKAQTLNIVLKRKDGRLEKHLLPLEESASGTRVDKGLPAAGNGRRWFVYKLTRQGNEQFKLLQQAMRHQQDYDHVTINVTVQFTPQSSPEVAQLGEVNFQLWLKLTPADGFREIYKGAINIKTSTNK